MAIIADYYLDLALAGINDGTRIDICSTEPINFTQATVTYTLGNKTSLTVGAPTDATPNGRKVVVPAITDGSVTANGTAGFWALSDVANSRLIAAKSLTATQVVTSGNVFTLDAIDITLPDAV